MNGHSLCFLVSCDHENDVLSHVFPVEAEDRSVDGSTAHKEEMVDQMINPQAARSDQWPVDINLIHLVPMMSSGTRESTMGRQAISLSWFGLAIRRLSTACYIRLIPSRLISVSCVAEMMISQPDGAWLKCVSIHRPLDRELTCA